MGISYKLCDCVFRNSLIKHAQKSLIKIAQTFSVVFLQSLIFFNFALLLVNSLGFVGVFFVFFFK